MRGSYQAWSPSPHSSPVKGEEADKLTALPSLFCAAFWRCTQPARFRRFWLLLVALAICGLRLPRASLPRRWNRRKDRPRGCAEGRRRWWFGAKPSPYSARLLAGSIRRNGRHKPQSAFRRCPLAVNLPRSKWSQSKIGAEEGVVFNFNSSPLFFLAPAIYRLIQIRRWMPRLKRR